MPGTENLDFQYNLKLLASLKLLAALKLNDTSEIFFAQNSNTYSIPENEIVTSTLTSSLTRFYAMRCTSL